MRRGRAHGVGRVALAIWLSSASALAQQALMLERDASDGAMQLPQAYAVTQGPLSLATHPAGLVLAPAGFAYLHEEGASSLPHGRRSDAVLGTWGGLSAGARHALALGLGAEWVRPRSDCSPATPCARRLSLGLAGGTPTVALGAAWRWFDSDESAAVDRMGTLDLGATWRPARWLSVAVAGHAVNAPNDVARRGIAGVGVRPFGERLTLAADVTFDERSGVDGARLSYFAGLRLQAVELTGEVAHQPGKGGVAFLAAVRLPLGQLSVSGGGGARVNGGDGAMGGAAVEWSQGRSPGSLVRGPSVVRVTLSRLLAEPPLLARLVSGESPLAPSTRLALHLQQLRGEPGLRTVVVVIDGLEGLSWGRIEELRTALLALRESGRRVVAFLPSGGDLEYYLATSADSIFAAPQALLAINGLATTEWFVRRLLVRLGVTPEFVTAGRYKSAPETFTRDGPSAPSVEAINAILDDRFGRYVAAIGEARGIDAPAVRALLDRGLFVAEDAHAAGLIDGVAADGPELDRLVGGPASEAFAPRVARRWGGLPAIALVEVRGQIVPGDKAGFAGAERVVAQLRAVRDDASMRALVLRVESPGGDVAASERIWRAVREVAAVKPVVASLGDVAASGGYYVAVGAGTIVAQPSSLTGSIGVFAGKADLSQLLASLGVAGATFQRGALAGLYTLARPWRDGERTAVEKIVHAYYETFLQRVAIGRKISVDEVSAAAEGRVWTGAQALGLHLVDRLGGLDEALRLARQQAGLQETQCLTVAGSEGLLSLPSVQRLGSVANGPTMAMPARLVGAAAGTGFEWAGRWQPLFEALAGGRPMALALELPDVW